VLPVIVAALLVLVALTILVILVVGLAGRLSTLRRQVGMARQRLESLDAVLGRPVGPH